MRFERFRDRLTYLMAEAQVLLLGILLTGFMSLAFVIWYFQPTLPGVPPLVVGWLAAGLLFGPAVFGFFVWLIKALRRAYMIPVVNAETDTLKKYYVHPKVWEEKKVTGATPYPVNGGSGWAVKEFEHQEDLGQLVVKGVWLSECEDQKLYTKKSHMEAIYGKLTKSHIALGILRDSVNELGADIQRTLINQMALAREKGRMMDENAVKSVFEEFEDNVKDLGADELPTLEVDETAAGDELPTLEEAAGDIDVGMGDGIGPEAPADD